MSVVAWAVLGWLVAMAGALWVWYRLNRFNQKGPRQYGMPRPRAPQPPDASRLELERPLDARLPAYRRRRKIWGKPRGDAP